MKAWPCSAQAIARKAGVSEVGGDRGQAVAAAEAFVGRADGCGDLAHDVHLLRSDHGDAGAGTEHAGGGLVVVGEWHGDAGSGEGGHREEAAALNIGPAEVRCGENGIPFGRLLAIGCA